MIRDDGGERHAKLGPRRQWDCGHEPPFARETPIERQASEKLTGVDELVSESLNPNETPRRGEAATTAENAMRGE